MKGTNMNTQLKSETTGLVLVDPQVDLLTPNGGAWDLFREQVVSRQIIDRLASLRDAADREGIAMFYSRIEITDEMYDGMTARTPLQRLFHDRRLLVPGRGAEIIPELEPTPQTVLFKSRQGPSPSPSDMFPRLRKQGIETVVIAGVVANLCVDSHVREAVDNGFNVVVVKDAIATTSEEAYEATLNNFALLATEVVTTKEFLDALQSLEAVSHV